MTRTNSSEVPLTPAAFYILFALADSDKHGYAIMQEIGRRSEGGFHMGPATLYTNIQRLQAGGLIKEVSADSEDARRRIYRLTRQGKAAMEGELERMRKVLRQAQSFSLVPKAAR